MPGRSRRAEKRLRPRLAGIAALVTAGALGLALAFAWSAEAATTEIVVSPLAIVSGGATGTAPASPPTRQ